MRNGRASKKSFAEQRKGLRQDVTVSVQTYSRLARVYTDAVTEHADATVGYVEHLLDPKNEHSAGVLIKDGVAFGIGCLRRSMKVWHELYGALGCGKPSRVGAGSANPNAVVAEVDSRAQTTGPKDTPFLVAEIAKILKTDLHSAGGTVIPKEWIMLNRSDRSDFVLVTVSWMGTLPAGTYTGMLVGPNRSVSLTVIKS